MIRTKHRERIGRSRSPSPRPGNQQLQVARSRTRSEDETDSRVSPKVSPKVSSKVSQGVQLSDEEFKRQQMIRTIESNLKKFESEFGNPTEEPGYTDEDCINYLRNAGDDADWDEPHLYACLRQLPCDSTKNEKPMISHGRKYCSNRKTEAVSQPGYVQGVISVLKERTKARAEEQALKQKYDTGVSLDTKVLRHKMNLMFEEMENALPLAKEAMSEAAEKDETNALLLEDAPRSKTMLKEYLENRQQLERLEAQQAITANLNDVLSEIRGLKQVQETQAAETQKQIDAVREKMDAMDRYARLQLGESTWSEYISQLSKEGLRKAIVKILFAPLTAIQMLWWEPLKYAFGKTFGWLYELYAYIVLIFTMIVLVYFGVQFHEYYPEAFAYCSGWLNYFYDKLTVDGYGWAVQFIGPKTVEVLSLGLASLETKSMEIGNALLGKGAEFFDWFLGTLVTKISEKMTFSALATGVGGVASTVASGLGSVFGLTYGKSRASKSSKSLKSSKKSKKSKKSKRS